MLLKVVFLILLSSTNIQSVAASAPELVTTPEQKVFTTGDMVMFTCFGTGYKFKFFFNDEQVYEGPFQLYTRPYLQPQFSGQYTCVVFTPSGQSPISNIIEITVVDSPTTTEAATTTTTSTGSPDVSNRTYFVFEESVTFQQARHRCRNKGYIMVMPKTAAEFANINTAAVGGRLPGGFWLGLKRERGFNFEYANGEALVYSNWKKNQPNNNKWSEGCALVGAEHGRWWDWSCVASFGYACQFPLDGKHNYTVYAESVAETYIDAVISCRSKGGDIAMPESAEENERLVDVVRKHGGTDFFWIGVQRKRVNWRWIDGELQTFSFNVWADGEPGNYRGQQYCASYQPVPQAWYDEKCKAIKFSGYVCQDTIGMCVDYKPIACHQKVKNLTIAEKRDYCEKKWPMEFCLRTCGCPNDI